jgi:mRNA interferase YafQ
VRKLVLTPKFKRAFRRLVRKNPGLKKPIEIALRRMEEDLNNPILKTHHLSGKLTGFFACSCGYDCRIVFTKAQKARTSDELIVLVNIGSHDEVY